MIEATHFIDSENGAWIKGVNRLIPNLHRGDFIYFIDDKSNGYQKHQYKISDIETVIGNSTDTILQNVMLYDLGIVVESIDKRQE